MMILPKMAIGYKAKEVWFNWLTKRYFIHFRMKWEFRVSKRSS